MISNVSGFFVYSDGLFYISENRNDLILSQSNIDYFFEEIIRERLPFNIIVSIKRIGLIEFDFSNWSKTKAIPEPEDNENWKPEKEWNITKLRLLVMNVFLSIFYTHYENIHKTNLKKFVITSTQQITRSDLDSPNIGFGSSMIFDLYSFITQNYPFHLPLWIKPEVIKRTLEDFRRIFHWKYKDYWYLIDNIAVAHLNHQNNHYSQSLAITWTVIESLLIKMWKESFSINKKFSDAQLKASILKLNNNKYKGLAPENYSSDLMLKVLEDFLIIKKTKAKKLHSLRKTRNKWIHKLKEIKMKDSHIALHLVIELLNTFIPIKLTWSANSSYYCG